VIFIRVAGGLRMLRQVEMYNKIADDYDQMARLVSDRGLQNMYLEFAQQWRQAAALRRQNSPPTVPADGGDVLQDGPVQSEQWVDAS
jgi:hypothetical protein